MENPGFISDKFDVLKTLQIKERSLLGDLRVAYRHSDLGEFLKLLRRTGYKNTQPDDENSKNAFLSQLKIASFRTSRNLLFERDDDMNLFEEILRTSGEGNSKFINLIWTECELWRKRDVLMTVNPKGKQPIDYVITSNDDENLFAFLVFDFDGESESVTKASKHYFLKLKNEQYTKKTGESLFQKFYSILDENCETICMDIMEKLLKEVRLITDIKEETAIDVVLKMENETHKHNILKLLMKYWKVNSRNYSHYKTSLSNLSPYYSLILTLKERHEFEFEELFPKYLQTMKEKHGEGYESMVRKDCNSLLEFALRHSQRKAINIIIECPLIDANKVSIKTEDSSYDSQIAHYFMSKLLRKGYYLANGEEERVPSDWISAQVFESFLDTRVSEDGIHGCQIDYSFLIDPKIRNETVKTESGDNAKLLFSRGVKSLQSILSNERLKTSIKHPVLSTFINLKAKKFRMIFDINFYIFLIGFMIPFCLLVTLLPFNKFYNDIFKTYGVMSMEKKMKKVYRIFGLKLSHYVALPYWICLCSTIYLTLRESFQLFFVSDKRRKYFKKASNQLEIVIIVLAWTLLYAYKYTSVTQIKTYMVTPSAFIIILATIELLSILSWPSMSIYMFMFEEVTRTFIKFFTIFILVIIAFTFSFCVVLKPPNNLSPTPWKLLKKEWNNYTDTANASVPFNDYKDPAVMFINALDDALKDNGTVFRNFENPFTSFLMTLQMLSGEFSIDPYMLDSLSKQLLLLFFILVSFILFNLMNGLAISDIALLKTHAEFLCLKQQIRNVAETEGVVCDFYWRVSGATEKTIEMPQKFKQSPYDCWKGFITYMMSLLIREYPFLHKMDNLCVDFKKRTVKYEQDQKRFHVLQSWSGKVRKYFLDDETLKKLSNIVTKRHMHQESVKEKVESLQADMKKLKISMKAQHEELKKLIQDSLAQRAS